MVIQLQSAALNRKYSQLVDLVSLELLSLRYLEVDADHRKWVLGILLKEGDGLGGTNLLKLWDPCASHLSPCFFGRLWYDKSISNF